MSTFLIFSEGAYVGFICIPRLFTVRKGVKYMQSLHHLPPFTHHFFFLGVVIGKRQGWWL
jgi:hypothetical protein